jgi:Legionella pneumophila major outer membrane protein precursor
VFKQMFVSVAALTLLQGVSANMDDWYCGQPWVAGEALLLRPTGIYPYTSVSGLERSPQLSTNQSVTQRSLCRGYEWGYKIEVGYRLCMCELLVNWLSFNNTYRSTLHHPPELSVGPSQATASDFFPVFPVIQAAIEREVSSINYDVLDAEMGRLMCMECSCLDWRVAVGLRYARVVLQQEMTIGTDLVQLSGVCQSSDVQGMGPRVVLSAHFDLVWGFGLSGSLSGDLLIGSAKSGYAVSLVGEDAAPYFFKSNNPSYCRLLPAAEIKFGVDYELSLWCGLLGFGEVGYQLTHYVCGSQNTLYAPAGIIFTDNRVLDRPISFDGWSFRLGLMY